MLAPFPTSQPARTRLGRRAVLFLVLCAALFAAVPAGRASALVEGFHPYGRSMWIWYVDRSAGGNLAALAAQARAADVRTLIIKSSDGSSWWSQFSPALVARLHAFGLHVCAWQYVYGTAPATEAALGAEAARDGADCLVIDAEAEYEGRYASAQAYMADLRAAVGRHYGVGLASFPYIDYHPGFPYSVFLGPGAANFNMPQMYWGDIGSSVDDVYAHTYAYNRLYQRSIYPLGQTYGASTAAGVGRFRSIAFAYGVPGISWFDYAWTSADALWGPIGDLLTPAIGFAGPTRVVPVLREGAAGDDVLWLQEHLAAAIPAQRTTGLFGGETRADLIAYQRAHGLAVTGLADDRTWRSLLSLRPVAVAWTASAADARVGAASPRGVRRAFAPASARLPARAYEVPEVGGALAPSPIAAR
jgi:peptidoglycan hydrolase-like protein with peptidoglycan-binding domain